MTSRSNREGRDGPARVYGTPTGYTPPSNVQVNRPRAAPATAPVRRAALDQRLRERQPVSSAPKPPPASTATGMQTGVSPNTMQLLRDRGKTIDKEVDKNSR